MTENKGTFQKFRRDSQKTTRKWDFKNFNRVRLGITAFSLLVAWQLFSFALQYNASQQKVEQQLQEKHFIVYSAEVTIEDAIGKPDRRIFLTEKALGFLGEMKQKVYGYAFRVPKFYTVPETSKKVALSYDLRHARINERGVDLEYLTKTEDYDGIVLKDREVPLKNGKNLFEFSYTVHGVPIIDSKGHESFRGQFPRPRRSRVGQTTALVILPSYVDPEKYLASAVVKNYFDESKSEPVPAPSRSVRPLKGKKFPAVIFRSGPLESYDYMEVTINW